MTDTNRDLALKRFNDAKGNWQVRSFESPEVNDRETGKRNSDVYCGSKKEWEHRGLGGMSCIIDTSGNVVEFDEETIDSIVHMHNSFDGLLEACKELIDDILNPRFNEMNRDVILKKPRAAIAKAEGMDK